MADAALPAMTSVLGLDVAESPVTQEQLAPAVRQ
jgi:hypothetical protein